MQGNYTDPANGRGLLAGPQSCGLVQAKQQQHDVSFVHTCVKINMTEVGIINSDAAVAVPEDQMLQPPLALASRYQYKLECFPAANSGMT